ncbi:MAG: hypothetical protein H8D72_00160 [Planctomycetes bacterium]|nr:hypothetical protein [Planctomycetota bacterium]
MTKLLLALAFAALALPQEPTRPDPKTCSVCKNQPAKMARLDVVSHGGFRFGRSDTNLVERIFGDLDIYWIEGEHVKLGFAATEFPYWPGGNDPEGEGGKSNQVRGLANGALAMKPFARAHAYLERAEATYARVQELLIVEDEDFPRLDPEGNPIPSKKMPGTYMGEGPYLGQAAKFELLILPGPAEHGEYLSHPNGLGGPLVNRVLIKDTDAISLAVHLQNGEMWDDPGVWGYVTHHLTHAFSAGYKHDSYPTPVWLESGLAHALEREVNTGNNSFCGSGEVAAAGAKINDWNQKTKELLRGKSRAHIEGLLAKETIMDFTLEDHILSWSMVRFLMDEHPKALAAIKADLHGLSKSKKGVGGSLILNTHKDAFARHLNMTYEEFDKAWSKWAKKQKSQG